MVQLLDARLETDCLQIQGALEIPELDDLKKRAEQFSLCLFVALGSAALNCGGPTDPFLNCSAATLRELMVNPKLNCASEPVLRAILQHWSTVTGEEGHLVEELVEQLSFGLTISSLRVAAEHLRNGSEESPLFKAVLPSATKRQSENCSALFFKSSSSGISKAP